MSLAPKTPPINLPTIRNLPTIPLIGCASGDATSYFGNQFGGLPDLESILHMKARKKYFEEMIETLIEGYVPAIPRQAVWAVRVAGYTNEIANLITEINTLIAAVTAYVNSALGFVNDRIDELNSAKNDLLSIPEDTRSKVQQKMIERYDKYIGRLEAQATRLQLTLTCIGA